MSSTEVRVFVTNFLIDQTPPTVSVIKMADGRLTVEPGAPAKYDSTTSNTTGTTTSEWSESLVRTTICVKEESLSGLLRGSLHPQQLKGEGQDTDQVPDSDSDYEQDYDFKGDDEKVEIVYEDTLRCHPPLAPEGVMALIKLKGPE
jgi:hypothetical protein